MLSFSYYLNREIRTSALPAIARSVEVYAKQHHEYKSMSGALQRSTIAVLNEHLMSISLMTLKDYGLEVAKRHKDDFLYKAILANSDFMDIEFGRAFDIAFNEWGN